MKIAATQSLTEMKNAVDKLTEALAPKSAQAARNKNATSNQTPGSANEQEFVENKLKGIKETVTNEKPGTNEDLHRKLTNQEPLTNEDLHRKLTNQEPVNERDLLAKQEHLPESELLAIQQPGTESELHKIPTNSANSQRV
jgi:hypothetical protein